MPQHVPGREWKTGCGEASSEDDGKGEDRGGRRDGQQLITD